MTAHLVVEEPGLMTSIQDLGRIGWQASGVTPSGALDGMALRLANALVGNAQNIGGLEIRMVGPVLRVEAESVQVALVGTTAVLEVLSPEAARYPSHRTVTLYRGDVFKVGETPDGAVCYLAVKGGFGLPKLFGSQATHEAAALGGIAGRGLRAGDALPLVSQSSGGRQVECMIGAYPVEADGGVIRVVLGPQDDHFTTEGVETFLTRPYTLSQASNRMGARLDGPKIAHRDGFDIPSDGIVTGSIQVPGTGLPIILLADRQTTGGYPKIATVISSDLGKVGRMKPGTSLRFKALSVVEAESARHAAEASFDQMIKGMSSVTPTEKELTDLLWKNNLISGVVGSQTDLAIWN